MRLKAFFLSFAFSCCSSLPFGASAPEEEIKQASNVQQPLSEVANESEKSQETIRGQEEDELPHSKALEAQVSFENSEFGLKDSAPGRSYAARTIAKIRSGAGEHFPVIGMLPEGKKIYVIQIQGGWAQIGPDKWVSVRSLSIPK